MATELGLLIPEFRKPLADCIDYCKAQGIHIEVMTTLVTPLEQAALWKQGRTKVDADLKALALENAGAPFLAECLRRAVPQGTNRETDELPGNSWQQWGEAASVIWVDGSRKISYSIMPGKTNGYRVFAAALLRFNLHSGSEESETVSGFRTARLRKHPTPQDAYRIVQIDAEMKKRFFK